MLHTSGPLSISTRHVDLPEIDIPNVRSNLSKGGRPSTNMLRLSLHHPSIWETHLGDVRLAIAACCPHLLS